MPEAGSPGFLWERATSIHRSSWSYVLEAKPEGKSVTWLGLDSPHGTTYLPFFGAATEGAPDSFHSHEAGMSKFSTKVAWWAFNLVNQYTGLNFRLINAEVLAKSSAIEARARFWRQSDPRTDCSNEFAEAQVAEWWVFAWSLFGKCGRYVITHNETAKGEEKQFFLTWWLESPEVGYVSWAPQGPFHGVLVMPLSALAASSPASPTSLLPLRLISLLAVTAVALTFYRAGMKHGLRLREAKELLGELISKHLELETAGRWSD